MYKHTVTEISPLASVRNPGTLGFMTNCSKRTVPLLLFAVDRCIARG